MSRQALSKKLRFEVFKRDAFTCQYCGRKAPEIVLECDHINPVAAGGGNDILNLVTSCVECNAGKGARSLSDSSVLTKQMDQLAELQARREQIEMLLDWRKGLESLQADVVDSAVERWEQLIENSFHLTATGKDTVRKLIKKFGLDHVLHAMSEAIDSYGRRDGNHEYTKESISLAFSKLGGVCRVLKDQIEKPHLRQMFYIRGILRNRLHYLDERLCISLMERAIELDVDLDSVEKIARRVRNWSAFRSALDEYIASKEGDAK